MHHVSSFKYGKQRSSGSRLILNTSDFCRDGQLCKSDTPHSQAAFRSYALTLPFYKNIQGPADAPAGKDTCGQTWWSELSLNVPHGEKELTSTGWPVTSTCAGGAHTHTQPITYFIFLLLFLGGGSHLILPPLIPKLQICNIMLGLKTVHLCI